MKTSDKEIALTIVVENSCLRDNLLAQHGVSFLLSYYGQQYLFDCGQIYEGLQYNIDALGIDLNEIDSLIISHDHHDHCLSLKDVLSEYPQTQVYVPTDFKSISHQNIHKISENFELSKGLYVLLTSVKNTIPEQSLVIDLGSKGLIIIVGCSHSGVEYIVESAIAMTGNKKISGIVGGLHMVVSKEKEMVDVIDYLKSLHIDFLVPGHCTGIEFIYKLINEFGDKVKISPMGSIGVGNSMRFSPDQYFDMRGW